MNHYQVNSENSANGNRLVSRGDKVIICGYAFMSPESALDHQPIVAPMEEGNKIKTLKKGETPHTVSI